MPTVVLVKEKNRGKFIFYAKENNIHLDDIVSMKRHRNTLFVDAFKLIRNNNMSGTLYIDKSIYSNDVWSCWYENLKIIFFDVDENGVYCEQ